MSRRNPPAKWVLPLTVHPATTTCWKIEVPDDPYYRAAFWGALLDLASAYKWQDDTAHTAKEVALVWRNIIDNLKRCTKEVEPGGSEVDFDMGIRIDCDCRVWVTCCDGTEVELATVGMISNPPQPGGGESTPPPAGGCETYHAAFSANNQWLMPAVVNAGDTLTFNNWKGAGTDGSVSIVWNCPNGQIFFAGACVGLPGFEGGDPDPSLPHMGMVALINGTYYDVTAGTITVPGGVSDAQVILQVNDSNLADNSGSYTVDVEFCNNNTPTDWVSTFNFVLNPYSSLLIVPWGTWSAGQGWKGVNRDSNNVSEVVLHFASLSAHITRLKMVYTTPGQTGTNGLVGFETQAGFWPTTYIVPGPQSSAVYDQSADTPGVTDLFFDNNSGTTVGDTFIQVVTVYGTGARPAGWPTS